MNKKERVQLIKSITQVGDKIDTKTFGIQPVSRFSEFNCYLRPTGKADVRYSWNTIHDLLKEGHLVFENQEKQSKIQVSFNRAKP